MKSGPDSFSQNAKLAKYSAETVIVKAGEWVRYSAPDSCGAEYNAVFPLFNLKSSAGTGNKYTPDNPTVKKCLTIDLYICTFVHALRNIYYKIIFSIFIC